MEKIKIVREVVLVGVLVFLSISMSFGDETKEAKEVDGLFWQSNTEMEKSSLVVGFFLGSIPPQEGTIISRLLMKHRIDSNFDTKKIKNDPEFKEVIKELRRWVELLEKDLKDTCPPRSVNVGTVEEGIDAFYKDFSNRKIKLIDAFYVVKWQIEGVRSDVIEAQIRYLKMQPISEELQNDMFKKYWRGTWSENMPKEEKLKVGYYIDGEGKEWSLFKFGSYK